MAEMTWLQRHGLTPAKGIAIAGLSIVLVSVLVYQFAGDDVASPPLRRMDRANATPDGAKRVATARTPSASKRTTPPASVVRGVTADKSAANDTAASGTVWPTLPLADVLANNPLPLPRTLAARIEATRLRQVVEKPPAPATTPESDAEKKRQLLAIQQRRQAALARLMADGVDVMIRGSHGKTALIGSKWTHVGDVIEGFIIRDIRPDGVVLGEPETAAAERTR